MIDTFGQFLLIMFLKIAQKFFSFLVLSNINVVLATSICFIAFSKLPNNQPFKDYLSLAQLCLICWSVYIFDRLRDNIISERIITSRHQFHFDHQFILQILMIAAIVIAGVISFFQSIEILLFGGFLGLGLLIYLLVAIKKWPLMKEFLMPVIYSMAVVGVPFVSKSSISLSSWILGFMFFILTLQNAFTFSFFESIEDGSARNIAHKLGEKKTRKFVNRLTALQIFVVIIFFSSQANYPNLLSFVFLAISVLTSLIIANASNFEKNYRWIVDGLLFLPLIIF